MGASGAGKSSLLNVLAGRSGMTQLQIQALQIALHLHIKQSHNEYHFTVCPTASNGNVVVSGNVFVAGRKINPVKFRENIAYVMQDDSLLPTATPREALEFSANLRSVIS
jgi:ABC-type multidrug transport system ATPase subunit